MPHHRITIAHLVFSMNVGGMENGIVNIANGLDAESFETHIICLEEAGVFRSRLRPNVVIHTLGRRGEGVSFKLTFRLWRLLARINPDVLHTHNLGPLVYGVMATLFRFGIPILHGEHAKLEQHDRTRRRLLERTVLYRFCRQIHTVSGELLHEISGLAPARSTVFAIRNGVDTERYSPGSPTAARRMLDLPEEGIYMGLVGRLVPAKRHKELLEAFNLIARENPQLRLLLVGNECAYKAEIDRLIALSPYGERIHFRSFREDPLPFYHALDLLVLPSATEGLSNVVLEGMACGLPLIVHQACGNAEVTGAGRFAWMASLDTPLQIAEKVRELLQDPEEMRALGTAARQNAEQNLSLEAMVENYATAYRAIATPGEVHNARGSRPASL